MTSSHIFWNQNVCKWIDQAWLFLLLWLELFSGDQNNPSPFPRFAGPSKTIKVIGSTLPYYFIGHRNISLEASLGPFVLLLKCFCWLFFPLHFFASFPVYSKFHSVCFQLVFYPCIFSCKCIKLLFDIAEPSYNTLVVLYNSIFFSCN